MINEFQLDYYTRLRSWTSLRESLKDKDTQTICVNTDRYWQYSPISTFYLHPHDILSWPDPWQLIDDNVYCPYARALGIIYTLVLLGIKDIDLIDATDDNNIDVVLVVVNEQIVLNYWPETVLNNKLSDFTINRHYDITPIINKVGSL